MARQRSRLPIRIDTPADQIDMRSPIDKILSPPGADPSKPLNLPPSMRRIQAEFDASYKASPQYLADQQKFAVEGLTRKAERRRARRVQSILTGPAGLVEEKAKQQDGKAVLLGGGRSLS